MPNTPPSPQDGTEPARRRLRVEVPVGGAVLFPEDADLAVEAEDRAPDVGLAEDRGGVVDEVAGGEVVGAVEDEVVAGKELQGVGGVEPDVVQPDVHQRVQGRDGVAGGLDLGPAHVRHAVDHLALQVAQVHVVVVDDAQGAHAGGGQVEQGRRAEAAGADHQDLGVLEAALADRADLRNDQVPGVALHLVRRQVRRRFDQRSGRIQSGVAGAAFAVNMEAILQSMPEDTARSYYPRVKCS